VLTADNRSRDPKEPDGSAATLWGKINPKSFGDRVQFSKPGSEGDAKR
jgi:pre-mRNA-splicing helicase BRR2